MHFVFDCDRYASSRVKLSLTRTVANATGEDGRGVTMEAMEGLNVSCPDGFALSDLTLHPGKYDSRGRVKFQYICDSVIGHEASLPPLNSFNGTIASTRLLVGPGGMDATLPRAYT